MGWYTGRREVTSLESLEQRNSNLAVIHEAYGQDSGLGQEALVSGPGVTLYIRKVP